jgi:hypothetical protein
VTINPPINALDWGQIHEIYGISHLVCIYYKPSLMSKTKIRKIPHHHKQRLEKIGLMLKEMRFAEGKYQDEFFEYGVSRRQIQRGEHGCNISLLKLFTILDCYDYSLSEFFEGME